MLSILAAHIHFKSVLYVSELYLRFVLILLVDPCLCLAVGYEAFLRLGRAAGNYC